MFKPGTYEYGLKQVIYQNKKSLKYLKRQTVKLPRRFMILVFQKD